MSGDAGTGSRVEIGFWELLAFGCEMAMLAALVVVGRLLAPSPPLAVALTFGVPAITGLAWGLWLAPRAPHRLRDPALTGTKVVVFIGIGAALGAAGHPGWGTALAAVSVADALMLSRREATTAARRRR
jgi:hypothetical protein